MTRTRLHTSYRCFFVLGLLLAGCSGKDSPHIVGFGDSDVEDTRRDRDTGAPGDALVDAPFDARPDATSDGAFDVTIDTTPFDTAVTEAFADAPEDVGDGDSGDTGDAGVDVPDASPAIVPVGAACSSDSTCDPTGAHVGVCSSSLYPPDSTDPDPFCVAKACALGAAGTVTRCGLADVGICVPGGSDNECFPACTFPTNGATAPTGCRGKDACNFYGTQTDSTGVVSGVGVCSGGCIADADCKSGVCQREDGVCVATRVAYTKSLGDTCTGADGECPCVLSSATLTGYCTRFCLTGSTVAGCATGFTCDPGLLASSFSGVSPGLVGSCFKNCSTDADCTALSAYCATGAATGVRVCRTRA